MNQPDLLAYVCVAVIAVLALIWVCDFETDLF